MLDNIKSLLFIDIFIAIPITIILYRTCKTVGAASVLKKSMAMLVCSGIGYLWAYYLNSLEANSDEVASGIIEPLVGMSVFFADLFLLTSILALYAIGFALIYHIIHFSE